MPHPAPLSPCRAPRLGFFGKLPGNGDFVRAGLPEEVVDGWDRWVRAGLAESRAALGEGWLAAFLEAPVWRFRFAPGLLAGPGLAGVMAPSVDRAGRYFPLMLGAAMDAPPEPSEAGPWLTALADAGADAVTAAWAPGRVGEALAAAGAPPCGAAGVPGTTLATDGAPRVAATTFRHQALPPPSAFAALLDDGARQ